MAVTFLSIFAFSSAWRGEGVQSYQGLCVFDVDRTLTCGHNMLEEGCPKGHNCYSEQRSKDGSPLPSNLYSNEKNQSMQASEIQRFVLQQDAKCVLPGSPTCYDRAYVWSPGPYTSPKVNYPLRVSKDIELAVKMCESKYFAIAIATHGGTDFTQVQNSCPAWAQNCSEPSSCKTTKRCHIVKALHLDKMDPKLAENCNRESNFIQHDPEIPKGVMVASILRSLKAANEIESSTSFKIWSFDDEGTNRKSIADQHANFSSVLAPLDVQVQTCAFAPDNWTTYQTDEEAWRGNNLATGLDMASIVAQISAQLSWTETTRRGCKMSMPEHAGLKRIEASVIV